MNTRRQQTGAMLLEALIAILIFSMGILAVVGLQAASVKASSDAKYRSDASLLANQLIGQMWAGDRTPATLQANFNSPAGASYATWQADVVAALPGVANTPPTVLVQPAVGTSTTTSLVTIAIYWKLPSEPASAPTHQYITIAQISP
jgi:type IV pilus assembly protein PilV